MPNSIGRRDIARGVIEQIGHKQVQQPRLYNLNIPTRAVSASHAEVHVVPMGLSRSGERYERRKDPRGRDYFWATGELFPPTVPHETDLSRPQGGAHHADAVGFRPDRPRGAGRDGNLEMGTGPVTSLTAAGKKKGGLSTMPQLVTSIRCTSIRLARSPLARRRPALLALLAAVALASAGCDEPPTLPDAPTKAPAGNQASAPSLSAGSPAAAPSPTAPANPTAANPAPAAESDSQVNEGAATPGASTEKAMRGVGEKGSGYGGGIITEPVRQYWLLRDAAVFEIQIPSAINLFKAEHNRFPKDWAEFKREILDPASIQLPELRRGISTFLTVRPVN